MKIPRSMNLESHGLRKKDAEIWRPFMRKNKKKRAEDLLVRLVSTAEKDVLGGLVLELASGEAEVRRKCFEYLKKHVVLPEDEQGEAEGETLMALWTELEADLSELDEYGGGAHQTKFHVDTLLYELAQKLQKGNAPRDYRRQLLDEVIPYIKSGNAGMDDELYDVAYATCRDKEDWRNLAACLEATGKEWPQDHARRVYRQIGDHEDYLRLRNLKMKYGGDFYDLTTFYWERGEKKRAIQVAEDGLKRGEGRMDELRSFLAKRARESGDRQALLNLEFEQATDHLTLQKYKAFEKVCKPEEWTRYEPLVLKHLDEAWEDEKLKICMFRKDFEQALATLQKMGPPGRRYDDGYALKVAQALEERFPMEILAYYRSGLGDMKVNRPRKEYAEQAVFMAKVRHMFVDVLKSPQDWEAFARPIRAANIRRPAFQDEMARRVPGWKDFV
jgi:hypothetical protein